MSDLEESNIDADTAADDDDDDDDDDDEYEGVKPKITLGGLTKIDDDIIKIEDSDIESEQGEGGGIDSDEDQEDDSDDEKSDYQSADEPDIVMKPGIFQEVMMTGEDSDDSSDEDEDYLKKFDTEVVSNYIDIYHPESRMHNYDEVRTLSSEDGKILLVILFNCVKIYLSEALSLPPCNLVPN